jgi:hypothetical protein
MPSHDGAGDAARSASKLPTMNGGAGEPNDFNSDLARDQIARRRPHCRFPIMSEGNQFRVEDPQGPEIRSTVHRSRVRRHLPCNCTLAVSVARIFRRLEHLAIGRSLEHHICSKNKTLYPTHPSPESPMTKSAADGTLSTPPDDTSSSTRTLYPSSNEPCPTCDPMTAPLPATTAQGRLTGRRHLGVCLEHAARVDVRWPRSPPGHASGPGASRRP